MHEPYRLGRNGFDRVIILHPYGSDLAWSGSRWVAVDRYGFGIDTQVSNFATENEAHEAMQGVKPIR